MGHSKDIKHVFSVDHPKQLIAAIGYRKTKKILKNQSILIVSLHNYWQYIDKKLPKKYFSQVLYLSRPDYSFFFPIQIYRLFKAAHAISKINITSKDKIYCFADCQFISNYLISNYDQALSTLIIPKYQYDNYLYDQHNFVPKIEGKIANSLIFPLFKMHKTDYLVQKENQIFGYQTKSEDGALRLQYREGSVKVYDQQVHLVPITKQTKKKQKNIVQMHYPFRVFSQSDQKKKHILFLGSIFLCFDNLDHQKYAQCMNRCLNHIRSSYPNYQLLYKPHPRETKEIKMIDLKKFKILSKQDNLEVFLLKNAKSIHSVFSISSTGISTAVNFALNGYLYYKIFPFSKSIVEYYDSITQELPSECFITDLKTKPKKIF